MIDVCWISRPSLIVMLNMLEYHRGHFFEKGFVKMDIKSLWESKMQHVKNEPTSIARVSYPHSDAINHPKLKSISKIAYSAQQLL